MNELTEHQKQILRLTMAGYTLEYIAQKMGVSVWTLSNTKALIRRTLDAQTTLHAVVIAIATGQITNEDVSRAALNTCTTEEW